MKKYLLFIVVVIVNQVLASQRGSYAEFEVDATNALENTPILVSETFGMDLTNYII